VVASPLSDRMQFVPLFKRGCIVVCPIEPGGGASLGDVVQVACVSVVPTGLHQRSRCAAHDALCTLIARACVIFRK